MGITFKSNIEDDKIDTLMKRVLYRSALKIHQIAVQKVPVDSGLLKAGIKIEPQVFGSYKYSIVAGTEYAADVEYGTSPHYVSGGELKKWATRKLGDPSAAFAVAKSISKKGTNAQPFIRPALNQVRQMWLRRFFAEEFS